MALLEGGYDKRSLQREAQHIGHFVGIDKDDWMCRSPKNPRSMPCGARHECRGHVGPERRAWGGGRGQRHYVEPLLLLDESQGESQ